MRGIGYVACAWKNENTHGAVCAIRGEMHLKALLDELLNSVAVTLYLALPLGNLVANVGNSAELKVIGVGVDVYGARANGCDGVSNRAQGQNRRATVWSA